MINLTHANNQKDAVITGVILVLKHFVQQESYLKWF